MYDRKACKKKAKKSLKEHYILFVFLCLLASVIGTSYTTSYVTLKEIVKQDSNEQDETVGEDEDSQEYTQLKWQINEVVSQALEKNAEKILDVNKNENSNYIGNHIEIGYKRGVFAKIRNQIVSGSFIIMIIVSLTATLGSASLAYFVFFILAFLLIFFVWMFFNNIYRVIYGRMFLEGRIYEKVPMQRFAFLIYVKKWGKAAFTMLIATVYYNLWTLTLIGGIIKYFSYFAVPYIIAENPAIKTNKAITLSRRMMYGHKFECFKLHFSFIGWSILNLLTIGFSGIFYSNPYMEAVRCEYYAYIRKCAKENNIEDSELLNDTYLYEIPSMDKLTEAYGIIEDYEVYDEEKEKNIFGKIGDFFGVYFVENKKQEELTIKKIKYERVKYILEQREYATKLMPIPEKKKRDVLEYMKYSRKYSAGSIVLFFMFFSAIGWIWEVSLHLIQNGEFVNRGTMHGPYLPIYGTGGIIVLLCLYKLRKKPVLEFIGAILLCGFIEYFSGYMLEKMYNGQKWWNYNGYFLNIDGRVCAEGLLVFGIGGMIVVYFVVPIFDNFVKKIPKKIVVFMSIILLLVFGSDAIYSSKYPNSGKGISSSAKKSEVQLSEENLYATKDNGGINVIRYIDADKLYL